MEGMDTVFFHSNQYRITTDVYQGPLDLLLNLIEKAELDITVLSLAQVTDQFLEYVHQMREERPSEVSAFVVIASRLIQIKSAALLPKMTVSTDGLDEDSGEALAEQLRVYRRFRQLADGLGEREDMKLHSLLRIGTPDVGVEPALDLSGLNASGLAEIASRVFAVKTRSRSLSAVMSRPRLTIREKITLLVRRLRKNARVRFSSLLQSDSKVEAVVTFLAMLEMIKQNAVQVRQEGIFSDIEIESLTPLSDTDIHSEFGE